MLIRASQFPSFNSIVSDKSNSYELVISTFGQKPSDFSFTQSSVDRSFASGFVYRIGLDDYQWLQLFPGLLNQYPDKSVTAQVAELIENGVVRVYKLPSIKSAAAIPFNDKTAYKFLPEIARQYLPNPFKFEKFNSTAKAQAVVNGIKWTSEYLYRALEDVGIDAEILQKVQSNGNKNLDFGKQELIKYLADGKAGVYKVERVTASPTKEAKAELVPLRTNDKPPPLAPETSSQPQKSMVSDKKPEPQSLEEAAQRLIDAKPAVVAAKMNGQPLPSSSYTHADKQAVVDSGVTEKYLVRVIETKYAGDGGYIGKVRDHGGSIAWTAPFTMVEHGDTDAEALLNAFGTRYDPAKQYTVLIIDSEKMNETGDLTTIIPTNKKLQQLMVENPQITKVPPEVTKKVLSEDFSPKYYKFAKGMSAEKIDTNDIGEMNAFAKKQGFSQEEAELLKERHQLAQDVAAWEEFTGNGMTLDTTTPGNHSFGPVEVVMLDKKPVTLGQLRGSQSLISIDC
jgi:hypothetical protein